MTYKKNPDEKNYTFLDSSQNFLQKTCWRFFHTFCILSPKSTFLFFYSSKRQKWTKMTSIWRHIDVKKKFEKKNYTFLDSSQNFLQKTFWRFFRTFRILGSKSKKACFLAFSLYFLYKLPIKCRFSKKLLSTHFPSSQISQKCAY